MASLQRIVLFDMLGDELFSGRSMLSEPPMPKVEVEREETLEEIEPCPETLRSSVFVRIHDGFVVDANDDGAIDVMFGSDPFSELDGASSSSADEDSIREVENSEIRATPASLGRVSQPEISVAPSAPSVNNEEVWNPRFHPGEAAEAEEISIELVDSLFDDHAA